MAEMKFQNDQRGVKRGLSIDMLVSIFESTNNFICCCLPRGATTETLLFVQKSSRDFISRQYSTGDPRPTKQNSSIYTYVWLFPCMNHFGKKATCVEITITCGFSQIHLGRTIDIHKWQCPHEWGKNHIIDQII